MGFLNDMLEQMAWNTMRTDLRLAVERYIALGYSPVKVDVVHNTATLSKSGFFSGTKAVTLFVNGSGQLEIHESKG